MMTREVHNPHGGGAPVRAQLAGKGKAAEEDDKPDCGFNGDLSHLKTKQDKDSK